MRFRLFQNKSRIRDEPLFSWLENESVLNTDLLPRPPPEEGGEKYMISE
jgi:hypothetical protein